MKGTDPHLGTGHIARYAPLYHWRSWGDHKEDGGTQTPSCTFFNFVFTKKKYSKIIFKPSSNKIFQSNWNTHQKIFLSNIGNPAISACTVYTCQGVSGFKFTKQFSWGCLFKGAIISREYVMICVVKLCSLTLSPININLKNQPILLKKINKIKIRNVSFVTSCLLAVFTNTLLNRGGFPGSLGAFLVCLFTTTLTTRETGHCSLCLDTDQNKLSGPRSVVMLPGLAGRCRRSLVTLVSNCQAWVSR